MELKPGTSLQGGKYIIIRKLGQGGFGITYLAEQPALRRKVAIKEFFPKSLCDRDTTSSRMIVGVTSQIDTVDNHRKKFVKEAQNIAVLSHPGIIRIHDIFSENNTSYYVMEYMPGGSVKELIERHGPLPEDRALHLCLQVADTLRYVHARRITHLDIKPGNILLNSSGEAILIDFGLSKHYHDTGEETSYTPVGHSMGYAPIEQYSDTGIKQFSPSSDVYALTATLYSMLAGELPPTATEVADMHEDEFPGPDIPAWLRPVIYKGMQPRKHRYRTIDELTADISGLRPASCSGSLPHDIPLNPSINPDSAPVAATTYDASRSPVLQEATHLSPDVLPVTPSPMTAVGSEDDSTEYVSVSPAPAKQTVTDVEISDYVQDDASPSSLFHSTRTSWIIGSLVVLLAVTGGLWWMSDKGASDADKLIITLPQGKAVYTGPLDDSGLPDGQGEARLIDMEFCNYKGTFIHGHLQGEGVLTFEDGSRFEGQFVDGAMTAGTYSWPDGRTFEGTYENGKMNFGRYTWPDGSSFKGSFVNDKRHDGTYTWPDGRSFKGTYDDRQEPLDGKIYDVRGRQSGTVTNGVMKIKSK